jgi:hypothetical protein
MLKPVVLTGLMLSFASGCSDDPETGQESGELSLAGSLFEIDSNANLTADGAAGSLDWANVDDVKQADTASGANDNSYGGGAKEDDSCPTVGTGSIPNNKSDLKTFGVFHEAGTTSGDPGNLHLFWSRVQDPSGTTLMDFEFNQSQTKCGNGVNPLRTAGDLLLEYRIEQGGATATVKLRTWNGSAWGTATDLTGVGAAAGTLNSSAIAAGASDGLGALSARTFGEASIDLDFVFQKNKCTSFGSAFVKSRSSDSFTSALKDFIAPVPVNITNCGKVVIRKTTEPAGAQDQFTFDHTLATDPAQTSTSFQLADGGSKEFTNVLFGNGYTVTEAAAGNGFTLKDIDCSKSSGVTPTVDVATGKVTFDIDSDTDTVDCTYTNQAKGTLVVRKITLDDVGAFTFNSASLPGAPFTLTTTALNTAASKTFADLAPGTYGVSEAAKAGWHQVSATCDDGSSPAAAKVDAGETVTCTFVNERDRGAIKIIKSRLHAADGPGWHAHQSVTFQITGGGLSQTVSVTTNAAGEACVQDLVLSSFSGAYTVTELVPAAYVPEGPVSKSVSVTQAGTCAAGFATIAFGNIPLTNITMSVDSQVVGGTASTITCEGTSKDTDATGDGSLTLSNLTPGTYSCSVVIH